MTDKTDPRAALDEALVRMRIAEKLTTSGRAMEEATIACAEALALLVDAHLAAVKPKPEPSPVPLESLSDDTPVGHGWVMALGEIDLFRFDGNDKFTRWAGSYWGNAGFWCESELGFGRPATVGDLRIEGVPVDEWPDITAPEPEEPPIGSVVLDRYGDAWLRDDAGWMSACSSICLTWAELHRTYAPLTVIHRAEP